MTQRSRNAKPLESTLAGVLRNAPNVTHHKATATPDPDAPTPRSSPDARVEPSDGGPDCDYCLNRRYVLDAQGNPKPCPRCGMAQQWRIGSLDAFSSRLGIAEQQTFLNYTTQFHGIEDPLLRDFLETVEEFAYHPQDRWLVIWGERGNGKSHMCAAVANHLINTGTPALFVTVPDLLSALKQALDNQANTEQESYSGRMKLFKKAPVLILDDLGAESGSSWSDGVVFEILDYRYRGRLPTMIVTNCPLEEFDPRIASRLQDTALCTVYRHRAPDFRKRPIEERKAAR